MAFETVTTETAHNLVVKELERALELLKNKDYKSALVVTNEVSSSIASCFFEDVRRLTAERNALQASCREYNEKLTQLHKQYDQLEEKYDEVKNNGAMPT